jgi:cytochrome c-type biogenesis protein CcmH
MPPELSSDYIGLVERLREAVAARPEDLQGHVLLAQNEANIGNYTAAAQAQQSVVAIKDVDATAEDTARLGELLVLAAGGYVAPEAETALRAALNADATNGRARYYLGLMLVQTGRPDQAFRLWDALLREGPEDAPWIGPVRAQIMSVAELAGVRYDLPQVGSGVARGPSADDIEAASTMSAEERMEMIGGMVAGLSDRLAREGGPPQDWARLITSLGVLGETERAAAIHRNALEVFAGDAGALDLVNDAGQRAGVAN